MFLYLQRLSKKQTNNRFWNDNVLSKCKYEFSTVDGELYHNDDPSGLRIVYVFLRDTRLRM